MENEETTTTLDNNEINYILLEIESDKSISHPVHYTWLKDYSGIEVIDITRNMNFDLGNAIKYILRAGRKYSDTENPINAKLRDLKKACFYIADEIKRLQKNV